MSFRSIQGQDRAISALRRALQSDRVAHAYLFAGCEGVGKMTVAVEFAKALVCSAGSDDACDSCPACAKVLHWNHPDVHRIEPEGAGRQIKIDPVREQVIRPLSLKPFEAGRKIVLMDDAHAMNADSANCLLKTLEEPPPNSVLILVTSRPDQLLETILSRCQMIRFAPLAPGFIQRELEARGIAKDIAALLSQSSGGSLGHALKMAGEQELPEARRRLLDVFVGLEEANIIESAAIFTSLVAQLAAFRSDDAGTNVRAESRSVTEWLLDLAVLFYRDVAVRQVGFETGQLANADVEHLVDEETVIAERGIRAILDTIEEAKRHVRANVDVDAAVLDALSKIAAYRKQRAA